MSTLDDRIMLEPVTDDGEHYVIATVRLEKIIPQKCHGKTAREAVEQAASMLIDLCDVLYDDRMAAEAEVERLRAVAEAAKAVTRKCGKQPLDYAMVALEDALKAVEEGE